MSQPVVMTVDKYTKEDVVNYPRTNYEMTQEDYDKITEACKPVPMIMLNIGTPRSQQENANDAWKALGEKMGFEWDTVQPGNSKLQFTAIPSEPTHEREERLKKEEKAKLEKEIYELEDDIEVRQGRLKRAQEKYDAM